MKKIQFLLKDTSQTVYNVKILTFKIVEEEGIFPYAIVKVSEIQQFVVSTALHGTILENDSELFSGTVSEISEESRITTIVLTVQEHADFTGSESVDPDISRLLYNNAEYLELTNKLEVSHFGKVMDCPVRNVSTIEDNNITCLDDIILKDSIKIQTFRDSAISHVDLEISASWVAKIDGDIDITSKIANRFSEHKINTLTPQKLEASWPHFGDKMTVTNFAKQSRYFVGFTRLVLANTMHMNRENLLVPISIADGKSLFLRRKWYDHKLSICYGYDQFRKDNIKLIIRNPYAMNGTGKKMHINLGNVQEFISGENFFETEIGQKGYSHIVKMVGQHIAASMRDVKISFSAKYLPHIDCATWIYVAGYISKVSKIETKDNRTIKVEAMAFSDERVRNFLKQTNNIVHVPEIEKKHNHEITSEDIIHDIIIDNDGFTQAEKLYTFLQQNKSKINKTNYKACINKFLNANSTTITIVTKPLKTKHCQEATYDMGTLDICVI
jgi:hypothetical protein